MNKTKMVTITVKMAQEQHSTLKTIVARNGLTLQQYISTLIVKDMTDNWGYKPEDGSIQIEKLLGK